MKFPWECWQKINETSGQLWNKFVFIATNKHIDQKARETLFQKQKIKHPSVPLVRKACAVNHLNLSNLHMLIIAARWNYLFYIKLLLKSEKSL